MTEAGLFAIGCGVTFLFLGGVYIVLRSHFLEQYGSTNLPEEQPAGRSLPWPDNPEAGRASSAGAS